MKLNTHYHNTIQSHPIHKFLLVRNPGISLTGHTHPLLLLQLSRPTWEQLGLHTSLVKTRSNKPHLFLFTFLLWCRVMSRAHLLLCNVAVVTCVVDPWFCNYQPRKMKRPSKPLQAAHSRPPALLPTSLLWHEAPSAWKVEAGELGMLKGNLTSQSCTQ